MKEKINQILKELKENEIIGNSISNYGEWNHTRMWEVMEEEFKKILSKNLS